MHLQRARPRPLTPEQDELLQQEFRLRNDLGGNVFLLIRHTGMRIGDVVSLDDPAMLGYFYQLSECGIGRKGGKPIFGWFTLSGGPFDQ